jgi:hypothetical protein
LERFERIQTQFVVLVVLAIGLWLAQDFVASFAAREMMARTDLWTPDQWNDARVQRAFQEARQTTRLEVKLETNANGFHPERHDYLTVIAPTKREAIEGRRALVEAIRAAFAEDGPGLLNSSREAPYADPVPNATTTTLKQGCRGLALVLLLTAGASLLVQSRRAHLPLAAVFAVLVATLAIFTAGDRSRLTAKHSATWVDGVWVAVVVVLVCLAVIRHRKRNQ